MPFEVVFGIAAAVIAAGFVSVVSLAVHGAVRSARDPEYRARLEARSSALGGRSTTWTSSDPALDPGNPASAMFPGNPGNPL